MQKSSWKGPAWSAGKPGNEAVDVREESGGLGQRARGREEGSAGVRDGAVIERGKEGGKEGGGRHLDRGWVWNTLSCRHTRDLYVERSPKVSRGQLMVICLHPLNTALDPVTGPQQVLSKHGQVLIPTCLLADDRGWAQRTCPR